ncbi:MAG: phosphopantothenate/pantothenate synthetase [Thermoplasmata archaeon]|nr:phosphopantothenate/pantothenate synthetase [Thermoplasmata archaeon]
MKADIPADHPRRGSLLAREAIADGVDSGLVDRTGLIAHGRGEAFDYLLGEATPPPAMMAIDAAAASLLLAERPVISVNGNTAVLSGKALASLSRAHRIPLEVNIFHRTEERMARLVRFMEDFNPHRVLGLDADATIPGLAQPRSRCSSDGIFASDVVLVPLEDGDRAQALVSMGKTVVTVDLNPLSRTARMASITIVDNVVRAIPAVHERMDALSLEEAEEVLGSFVNEDNLAASLLYIEERLRALSGKR